MERESDLYEPVKRHLEALGFEVKGEVGAADLVAMRGAEPPLIVELKLRVALALYHQAVARLSVTERVYICVPRPSGRNARRALKDNLSMCRRLGLGFLTVRPDGRVEVQCDPGPYAPRINARRQARLATLTVRGPLPPVLRQPPEGPASVRPARDRGPGRLCARAAAAAA